MSGASEKIESAILVIHTDGGARGNPGPAACGVVIETVTDSDYQSRSVLAEFGTSIGIATNNVAEYSAVIAALTWLSKKYKKRASRITCYLDSLLVVNQLNGIYKVKDATLRTLLYTVRSLEPSISPSITYVYIPREQNKKADRLVNQTLDQVQ